jgi:hypothetical protein
LLNIPVQQGSNRSGFLISIRLPTRRILLNTDLVISDRDLISIVGGISPLEHRHPLAVRALPKLVDKSPDRANAQI